MKKIIPIILLFAALGFAIFLFAPSMMPAEISSSTDQNESPVTEPEKIDPIIEEIADMTIDEKIAQMLIVQPLGQQFTDEMQDQLSTAPYGGYILLGDNMSTLSATRNFVRSLQQSSKTPLIIATDQEGGLVQRLRSISDQKSTYVPAMYELGVKGDLELTKNVGRIMAEEMRVLGINVDFAPDADVFSNPQNAVIGHRSFSADPTTVANMSQALASGLEENGVSACYKHFPGHGNTSVDSHLSLPVIDITREELNESDLIPFKNAIKNHARMIMAGHIAMPKITGDNTPSTLSKEMLTGILRDELGFDGLIVTDGLNMGALSRNYPEEEIYYRAVEAGADLLVLPVSPDLAIQSIKEHIPEERIDESVKRILNFKTNYLLDYTYLDESYFGSDEHAEIIKKISE